MSVEYILKQAGYKMGLNPLDTNERAILLRFLNEAADELYAQSDMPGSLMEEVFKVNGDQTVSLPANIGSVRGIRELDSHIPWDITRMTPRYYQYSAANNYRTVRLKNKQALASSITNTAPLRFVVCGDCTKPISVTITGKTNCAARVSEVVVLNPT